jgi:hypothetical protein
VQLVDHCLAQASSSAASTAFFTAPVTAFCATERFVGAERARGDLGNVDTEQAAGLPFGQLGDQLVDLERLRRDTPAVERGHLCITGDVPSAEMPSKRLQWASEAANARRCKENPKMS